MTEILHVSNILSIGTLQGFLLRYITCSYFNWPRNNEPSEFKVLKQCLKKVHFTTLFRHFFQTSNSDGLPFLGQLRQEIVIYLKRKPYYPPFESRFEIGRISITTGSTRVLVKVVLFQLRGRGYLQNDAMPNIFPDSKSLLLGLSNEVSFVSVFFE